nr:SusC/RagA family TonB-linked outer membrane protein [Bacteroides neonati]
MMSKNIYIILISVLCSFHAMAQKDTLATSAVAITTSDKLSHKNSIKPSNQLFGMLPGLQVMQTDGAAWENGASLSVRGQGSLNSNAPLILVDGYQRSMDELTSEEIESVSVLKDAVATALYGIRGANGVILVKTKRGSVNEPQINFSYEFNMATPNRLPEFVDGYTYASALNEALRNDGQPARYSGSELDAFKNQTMPGFYPNVDWVGEALRDATYGDNVNFSAQGGSRFVRYYTSLNFLDNRGLLQPTETNEGYSTQQKYSKLNVRTNLDITVSPTTSVQLNFMGNFSEHNRPGKVTDDIFNSIYQVPAGAFPIKTDKGVWGGTTTYSNNPIAFISGSGYARSQTRALFADMHLKQDLSWLLSGLSVGFQIGLDNTASYWDSNTKNFGYGSAVYDWVKDEAIYTNLRNEGTLSFSKSVGDVRTLFNLGLYANYAKIWGKHNLNATMQYSMDKTTMKGRNTGRAFMDIVGQVHYAYNNRYLLDLSLSGSASSILDPKDRWGIFPALGVGWVLSNEDFLDRDWLSLLKVRASYGISGRADYEVNLFKTIYDNSGNSFYFGSQTPAGLGGKRVSQLGINGLTYEKSHKLNAGLDFIAWNKLSLSMDAFYDHRTDILVDAGGYTSSVLGVPVPKKNNGIVDNKGVEIALSWNDRISDFAYHIGGQFTFARNEIMQMNEEYRPYDYQKRTGTSIGQIFGYEVQGIYQSQEQIDNREVKQKLGTVRPGDLMFKDQNGDNIIDSYDQVALGYNAGMPEIYYSFDLGAEYKGVGVYAQFQGTGHYTKMLDTRSVYRPIVGNNTISTHYYENRWSESTPNGTLPRLTYTGSDNNYNNNSMWITDASFLKLRTLELYYNFPARLLKRTKFMDGAKLFARAHDLFCFDKIDLQDPEALGAVHPTMTQYAFGFNLSF